ncbi:MAG: MFS transporter [Clostridia bacterium]|nr:MFS transporter [Clostridia bacterium]
MSKKSEFSKALQIGTVCVSSYMVSYYMRNLLSVSSPAMLQSNLFTKEFLGTLSSVYMLTYAVGQLFNGVIGDIVKPKWMITGGMILCGLASICFSFITLPLIQIALFAMIGFSLSMLRGPLVKTISENTQPDHARVICTFFSFVGFSGPLIASLLSMMFDWRGTFLVGGITAIIIGALVYCIFSSFERKGRISYSVSQKSDGFKNIFRIFTLKHFVFYVLVGAIAEISAASISFWIPTYFVETLNLSETMAKTIYSSMALIKGVVPFLTLFLFHAFKQKDIPIVRYSYLLAIILFFGMKWSVDNAYINIACLLLAQIAIGISSSLLWSIYIPAQGKSGMVSTVNGFLDFSGYLFASGANIIFANVIGNLGWNGVINLWILMPALGLLLALFTKQE